MNVMHYPAKSPDELALKRAAEAAPADPLPLLVLADFLAEAGREWEEGKVRDEARRVAERLEHAAANPHLLTKADRPTWSPGRLAAENVRRDLKQAFPGVKFAVRSDYNTVNVSWTDGPAAQTVEAVAGRFQGGHFDGMNDIYERDHDATFAQVFGDPKYVFCNRDWTVGAVRTAWQRAGFDPAEVTDRWYDGPMAYHMRRAWATADLR